MVQAHGQSTASEWICRWAHLLAPAATVLDVACGRGRHMRWFAERGHPVLGIDRDAAALHDLAPLVQRGDATTLCADIENAPWPLLHDGQVRQFGAVVVTNYLWRPLLPVIVQSVAPGGVLLYETFAIGNASVGKPSRPDFLLQPGELLRHTAAPLRVVAYEDGFCNDPPRFVQRIAAVRPGEAPGDASADTPSTARYALCGRHGATPTG